MSKQTFFVGTRAGTPQAGIYSCLFDGRTFSEPTLLFELEGFSHCACSDAGRFLAVNHTENGTDQMSTWCLDGQKALYLGSVVLHARHDMSHLSLSHDDKWAAVTDFQDHAVHICGLDGTGAPTGSVQRIAFTGSGTSYRQDSAHPHSAFFSPDDRFLFVSDLGSNRIWTLLHTETGFETVSSLRLSYGLGPRHLVCHPKAPYLYSLSEINAMITVLEYDSKGILTERQHISGLGDCLFTNSAELRPDGIPLRYTAGGDIILSAQSDCLFASIRGPHIITAFRVCHSGAGLQYASTTKLRPFVRCLKAAPDSPVLFALGEEWRGDPGEIIAFLTSSPQDGLPIIDSRPFPDAFVFCMQSNSL